MKNWALRKTDKEVVQILRETIDTSLYGIGLSSYKKIRKRMGLEGTRGQKHMLETIHPFISQLRKKYPKAGARDMVAILFQEKGLMVSRDLVVLYFKVFEPEACRERRTGRLRRRRFWAAGVNDMFTVDQHDKWKRFGLCLHVGIDPFPGKCHWIRVWWTNSNPKLICSYYLDTIRSLGVMPLITQSDPGSENYGIANAHTTLRHMHDRLRSLEGTVQHRWMRHKKNVKPEATWSQFRRRFAPGFEDLLELGVTNGWYDITRPIDVLTFCWVFIPYIQSEVDAYVHRVNFTKKRSDKNKVLPHGIPEDIATNPGAFGCLDFGINVDPAGIDYVEQLYAPRDDPVFQLVPPTFHEHISRVYAELGCPPVTFETAWDVYRMLVLCLEDLQARADNENFKSAMDDWEVEAHLLTHGDEEDHGNDLPYGPPEGAELAGGEDQVRPDGSIYMGGVNGGRGLDSNLEARLDELTEADNDFEFEIDEQGVATEFEDDSDYEDLNPGMVGQW
ncbi:hypothetical protein CPC08DRAFT_645938 [Agrocybe pediades]|nr:hypothetical protein CPC08DRAFT_645938 [Agrocybe pediades]